MKVSGITILLVGAAAIGANAQVLKGTSFSSSPRLRKNVMKEADHRRLQTTPRTDITCPTLSDQNGNGYGAGCRQDVGPVYCANDNDCSSQNGSYQLCSLNNYWMLVGTPDTCVCIIPVTGTEGTQCTANYGVRVEFIAGVSSVRPCCYVGKYI